MKILIAEDDRTSRRMLEVVLGKCGYEVVSTCDGNEAWEKLQGADAPKLAILDWMMPGMEGIEICRRLRQADTTNPTYTIMLTALDSKKNVLEGLEAGADDYISKPFDKDELHARIEIGRRVVELQKKLVDQVKELKRLSQGQQIIINERKRAEEEQARLQKELFQAQKMESIGLLAGGIAHDFNNLLQGVLGYVQLIKVRVGENDPNYGELNLIEVVAEKAADLTQQLLSYARKGKYVVEPIAVEDAVEAVIHLLNRTIDKKIGIDFDVPPDIPRIKADASQFHQMLLNLCVNAKDAMPGGGELTISAEEVEIDEEYCKAQVETRPGKYVRLSIKDTGIGMDEETRAKIFEPFFTTKEVGKGTGLGLSMIYGVVKNHNGFIEVKSAPGEGSEFKIFLPAISEEPKVLEKKAPVASITKIETPADDEKKGKRVLVVDDEEIVRYLAMDLLKSLGHESLPAVDGQNAVEIFEDEKDNIDLVLLDMVMPKLGGVETFRELRKMSSDIPIVILSGYAKDEAVQELLDEGACGFIQKPYKLEELAGIVQSL